LNILCVIDSLGSGGAQRQIVELAKGFKDRKCNVSILVYHEENFFKGELDEANISVISIIESNYIKRLFKMRKFIRKGNYDAVLSFLEAASFISEFAGLPRRNWKLIVGERSANPDILKSVKRRFYRWFHVFADHVVANSHENLAMVQKINPLLASNKCQVIYNLVDFDYWIPAPDYIPCMGGKLNLVVGASHQYMKNSKGLIEAIDCLSEEEKQRIKVIWYGDESPDNSYKEAQYLVEKHGLQNIFFFNKATNNIKEKLQHADVIGLFSLYEGLPNVICESMSIGKPIISSAVSDISLLLNNDSKCLFDPRDMKAIANALSYILTIRSEELLTLGKFNRLSGSKLFDKNKIISSYMSLFKK
jgi:glycosyltransferase involved in cell wall biosynthesis